MNFEKSIQHSSLTCSAYSSEYFHGKCKIRSIQEIELKAMPWTRIQPDSRSELHIIMAHPLCYSMQYNSPLDSGQISVQGIVFSLDRFQIISCDWEHNLVPIQRTFSNSFSIEVIIMNFCTLATHQTPIGVINSKLTLVNPYNLILNNLWQMISNIHPVSWWNNIIIIWIYIYIGPYKRNCQSA